MYKNKLSIGIVLIGLFLSCNLYGDWEMPDAGTAGSVASIITQGDVLYAGSSSTGVYISVNKGWQWLERSEGLTNSDVQYMEVIGNSVFAGTNGAGVFISSNMGEKWAAKNAGLGNLYVYSLDADNDTLYAVTDDSGVFMSPDLGENWISLNNGDIIAIILYTIKVNQGKVYIGGQFGNLYTTTDRGLTWENLRSGPLAFNIKSLDIKGDKIIAGTSSGVFISNNAGKDWKVINSGLKNTDISFVAFNGDFIYAATKGGGIYITDNEGISWIAINEGLPDMNVLSLHFTDEYVYAGSKFSPVVRRLLSEIKVPEVVAPELISPEDKAENINPKVTFTWEESIGAKSYILEIALSTDFSNPIVQKDDIPNTTVNQILEKGLRYYWRLAANTPAGEQKWSEVRTFTTREDQTVANLISPKDKESNVAVPVKFIWNSAKGTASYQLQIANDSDFTSLVLNQVNITDTVFIFDKLTKDEEYFWHIATVGYDDNKMWTDSRSFTAGDFSTGFEYMEEEISKAALYPNPVLESLALNLYFDAGSAIIDVVSSNGSLSYKVYSGALSANSTLSLDRAVESLLPGLYFVRILSDNEKLVIPFVKL